MCSTLSDRIVFNGTLIQREGDGWTTSCCSEQPACVGVHSSLMEAIVCVINRREGSFTIAGLVKFLEESQADFSDIVLENMPAALRIIRSAWMKRFTALYPV